MYLCTYLIFVTGTTGGTCGEKICHVEKFQISQHDRCGEIQNFSTSVICVMWRYIKFLHICHVCDVWRNPKFLHICHLFCVVFCNKIRLFTIYAVLSQNLLCRDLRAFAWRKIEPTNCVCGEKMTNMRYGPKVQVWAAEVAPVATHCDALQQTFTAPK